MLSSQVRVVASGVPVPEDDRPIRSVNISIKLEKRGEGEGERARTGTERRGPVMLTRASIWMHYCV